MSTVPSSHLQDQLAVRIRTRTGRQLRNLTIELHAEKVILRGQSPTWYAKQLAQHAVREVLPAAALVNAIVVDNGFEFSPVLL